MFDYLSEIFRTTLVIWFPILFFYLLDLHIVEFHSLVFYLEFVFGVGLTLGVVGPNSVALWVVEPLASRITHLGNLLCWKKHKKRKRIIGTIHIAIIQTVKSFQ